MDVYRFTSDQSNSDFVDTEVGHLVSDRMLMLLWSCRLYFIIFFPSLYLFCKIRVKSSYKLSVKRLSQLGL